MKNNSPRLNLLTPDALVKTSAVDQAEWNYKPLLGAISRARFHLVKQLLGERRGKRLLEIGYGSGVFLPELAKHSDEIYGIDIHKKQSKVAEKLSVFDVRAKLVSGGAEKTPWKNDFFDFIVAVSSLEFVNDLDAVCIEVKRILKPEGKFIAVTPGQSPLLDFGLKLLTGKIAADDFGDRRERILPTLHKHFNVQNEITFPRYNASPVKLYTALQLQPKTL